MAGGQGKEEEKFDFTGEGEAVGYISLEQARVLAMQTAGETPGEYGSQYTQDISRAFEVVQSNEVRITTMSVPTTAVALLTVN